MPPDIVVASHHIQFRLWTRFLGHVSLTTRVHVPSSCNKEKKAPLKGIFFSKKTSVFSCLISAILDCMISHQLQKPLVHHLSPRCFFFANWSAVSHPRHVSVTKCPLFSSCEPAIHHFRGMRMRTFFCTTSLG